MLPNNKVECPRCGGTGVTYEEVKPHKYGLDPTHAYREHLHCSHERSVFMTPCHLNDDRP